MLIASFMARIPLKIDRNGHYISVRIFASTSLAKLVIAFALFLIFLHDIFKINLKLKVYLILLWSAYLILISWKIWRPNSKIFPENFVANFFVIPKSEIQMGGSGINLGLHWFWNLNVFIQKYWKMQNLLRV